MSRHAYRALTPADLTAFDGEARRLILNAIELGCTARISNRGHCIVRNSSGGTAAVSRNLTTANRTAQNTRADMKRLLAKHKTRTGATVITASSATIDSPTEEPAEDRSHVVEPPVRHVCADCGRFFRTPAALGSHRRIHREEESGAPTAAADDLLPRDDDEAAEVLARVREALGEDPRISVMAAKVHDLQAQLDDARARLALVTEAIRA